MTTVEKKRATLPEAAAQRAEYRQTTEYKSSQARYRASDKYKAMRARHAPTDERKAMRAKYLASDKGKATIAKYRASEVGKATQAKYRASEQGWERLRNGSLKKFGMTLDDFRRLIQQQGGKCALCGDPLQPWESADERRMDGTQPVVDHCHRSDGSHSVRGILHHTCNSAIGLLCDDPENARRAWKYLEHTRHVRPLRPVAHQQALEVPL